MTPTKDPSQQIEKLRDLVKDTEFCMLTTIDDDGSLHSRPMSTNGDIEENGDLWFFIYASSHKVDEINHHQQVNVSFSNPNKQSYVSMSGTAHLVKDRSKMQELWRPQLKAWFPQELDEPDIALLKVKVVKAEYWDAPSSLVAHTVGLVKAIATGEPADGGENEKINLN
jgi:general stress protein 26